LLLGRVQQLVGHFQDGAWARLGPGEWIVAYVGGVLIGWHVDGRWRLENWGLYGVGKGGEGFVYIYFFVVYNHYFTCLNA
jgi:hypothetical protein